MVDETDIDPEETQEWIESLDSVLEREGPERAHFLLERLIDKTRRSGAYLPFSATTAYVNTIPLSQQRPIPGDQAIEHSIRSVIRWNAAVMVINVWIPFYIYLSMYRVYGQGHFVTLLKFLVLVLSYWILALAGFMVALIFNVMLL